MSLKRENNEDNKNSKNHKTYQQRESQVVRTINKNKIKQLEVNLNALVELRYLGY